MDPQSRDRWSRSAHAPHPSRTHPMTLQRNNPIGRRQSPQIPKPSPFWNAQFSRGSRIPDASRSATLQNYGIKNANTGPPTNSDKIQTQPPKNHASTPQILERPTPTQHSTIQIQIPPPLPTRQSNSVISLPLPPWCLRALMVHRSPPTLASLASLAVQLPLSHSSFPPNGPARCDPLSPPVQWPVRLRQTASSVCPSDRRATAVPARPCLAAHQSPRRVRLTIHIVL